MYSAVVTSVGGTGPASTATNSGFVYAALKPLEERKITASEVINRLRPKLAAVPDAMVFLQAGQDLRIGGRVSNAQYQYTIQSEHLNDLVKWGPIVLAEIRKLHGFTDVNSDQQNAGLQASLTYDRQTAARLGISAQLIDDTLYDAFGQRQVSTIFTSLNQYHVVMEVDPHFWQNPKGLDAIYLRPTNGSNVTPSAAEASSQSTPAPMALATSSSTSANSQPTPAPIAAATPSSVGATSRPTPAPAAATTASSPGAGYQPTPAPMAAATASSAAASSQPTAAATGVVPLRAVASYQPTTAPIAVNHQGQFPSVTISFNLARDMALSDAVSAIQQMQQRIGMPSTVHGSFSGTAQAFQASLASEPFLILAALVAVYIVLGILYESYIHPITILSTLPSAGVGALLALMLFRTELSVIAIIGLLLLIGIVKKNAILMVDFALEAERAKGMRPGEAIYQACLLRFRPILMTTMAALFGALPLVISPGMGAELRRPLGIAIAGGLIFSQALTLYTTPVVYLYFDRLREGWQRRRREAVGSPQTAPGFSR